MDILKFKTSIKCGGCLSQVTPSLNEAVGQDNWQVDLAAPDKVLTVRASEKEVEAKVIEAVEKAGFKVQAIGS